MKVTHRVGEFVDFKGNTRKFIIVAVSAKLVDTTINEYGTSDPNIPVHYLESPKILSIGVSVCREGDKFDEALGIEIAKGKALKNRDYALYTTCEGLINAKMVNSILDQEVEFFKKDPGYYIKGYNEDRKKFNNQQEEIKYRNELPSHKQVIYDALKSLDKAEINDLFKRICGDI